MATNLTINGTTFSYPTTGDSPPWGDAMSNWASAVTTGMLQKAGGAFTLTADADFGPNFGLAAIYYKSRGTVASTGIVRLAKTEQVGWRNNSNNGDNLLTTDASDNLTYNGHILIPSAGTIPVASGGTGLTTLTAHGVVLGEGASNVAFAVPGASAFPLVSNGASSDPSFQLLGAGGGGTGVSSVTIAPAATAFAGWDANKNLSANSLLEGYTTIATAAGITTLAVGSTYQQYFTGSSTQTVVLPVATTLVNGQSFQIVNLSSGTVTVQTSGLNAIQAMTQNTQLNVTCSNTAGGTGTASWTWTYGPAQGAALSIAQGGTGQTTQATAFDALSPLTTQGDIPYYNGTHNVRLPPGTNGQILTSGGAGANPSWTTSSAAVENLVLNSAFDLWQRGTSTTIANTVSTYQPDRWYGRNALGTNGVLTLSQQAGSVSGSIWGAKLQITTAPTAAQTNGCELWTVLDNLTTMRLYGQTASLSLQVKALGNVNNVKVWGNSATSEAKLTSASTNISSTTAAVNSAGFTQITLNGVAMGTGMTTSGVVGIGISINTVSAGNAYDLNNGFIVEQVLLNVGSVAGAYTRAFYSAGAEISACQRFYWKSYDLGTAPNTATVVGEYNMLAENSTTFVYAHRFPVTMRAAPTIHTYSNVTPAIDKIRDAAADVSPTYNNIGTNGFQLAATVGVASDRVSWHVTADADI